MAGNFKLSPDNLRSETALIGGLIVLLGIFLYSAWSPFITPFLRPLLVILGAILVLTAAISEKE